MQTFILASASPARKQLLERLHLSFSVEPADVDETPLANEPPEKLVFRLAEAKAKKNWKAAQKRYYNRCRSSDCT